jgi:predicted SAM-dependent methyltransferase
MIKLLKKAVIRGIKKYGFDLVKIPKYEFNEQLKPNFFLNSSGLNKVHYGCGTNLFMEWLNLDSLPQSFILAHKIEKSLVGEYQYESIDLTSRQPFPDNTFDFAFSEDFIEHISQADSIVFLTECFRVLKPKGVLRLSFPGLEGVLRNCYTYPSSFETANNLKIEAYTQWEHLHFYSREELILVAQTIGYKKVQFVSYGESEFKELRSLDVRHEQKHMNTYVELIK